MENDFYTVDALAEKMGVSERTVRAKINKGEIPAWKWGGRWYVIKSELIDAIRSNGKSNGKTK